MERILAISDTVNAALHALALAELEGGCIAAREAAERLGVSPSYLAKIMQRLASAGMVIPQRGLGGGYQLARDAAEIRCLDVAEALEGPLPQRECLFDRAVCAARTCALRVLCEEMASRLRSVLENTSVSALARSFTSGDRVAR
ncbi:MAG: Rrf2 family transcriptional regulator [Rectinemataceae bacterium]|nr:Rrf2 family transcriptional regulator [Spirochaetaceae bacterium]